MKNIMLLLCSIAVFLIMACSSNIQAAAMEAEPAIVDIYDAALSDSEPQPTQKQEEYTGLSYSYLDLDDIPLLAVCRDDGTDKPLLIFLHGLGSKKESLLPVLSAYAEAGYYVVAMDSYDHGERLSEELYCDIWAMVLLTVKDVDRVIAYYADAPGVDTDNFVLGGFSMGGVETCVYAETGDYTPAALLCFSGLCEYEVWQPEIRMQLSYLWLKPWKSTVWAFSERQTPSYSLDKYELIRSMDITGNAEAFDSIPIFISIGEADTYFSAENAEAVAKAIMASGNEIVAFVAYGDVDHELTDEMISDSINFLNDNI